MYHCITRRCRGAEWYEELIQAYRLVIMQKKQSFNTTSSKRNILSFYPENIDSKIINSRSKKMLKNLRNYSPGIEIKRKLKNILRISSVKCCYKAVTRLLTQGYNRDKKIKIGPKCHEISDFETVVLNHDAIVVFCDSKSKGNFYVNVHLLVQDKGMVTATDEVSGNKLSVIIFGTDSVSRLNFHRVNPKTYNYLTKELNALEYGGYNKIGDNTLPNVLALSTGLTEN
ncbi:hypothetical protein Avbf_16291 [Armadillidium vulgare]|nr:hypothetical protein Avbf_16291 [Armadillidium vulgare]